jgi:hypothetical protein
MMNTGHVEVIHHATDLPDCWDTAAKGRFFLQRKLLQILEETNPCEQRYHIAGDGDSCSIAVTYRHRLNLLTFGSGSFGFPITIVGIPCSVSDFGYSFSRSTEKEMVDHLHTIKGVKLVLNTTGHSIENFAQSTTLPTCRLDIQWDSFPAYLAAMRSHYRTRVKKAQSRWIPVKESIVEPETFGEDLYKLYENVFTRSRYKLERLSIDYFRKFPADIVQFTVDEKPIAFAQTALHGDELIFLFSGTDSATNRKYDTYFNMLLYVINKGITAGCQSIDLGQTAEEIKCTVGCRQAPRDFHVAHSNRIGNLILQSLAGPLGYRKRAYDFRVFK